jgi:type IV fimbrial biogenesis protein FimT
VPLIGLPQPLVGPQRSVLREPVRLRSMKRTQYGLSLIEMIVGVSIVSILMAIGVPSYRYVTNSNRVSAEVNGLLLDLQFARSEAIKEGRTVSVCPGTAAGGCTNGTTWQGGWIVFMDINGDGAVSDANDVVLRAQASFAATNDTFTSDNAVKFVTFNREGFAIGLPDTPAGFVTATLHDKTASKQWTRCLEISTIGRLRTERAGDANGNCT